MVIWIIGLSASGKTTLGRAVFEQLKKQSPNTVLVDGDEVRAMLKSPRSQKEYTIEDRRENARRISELCLMLDRQNINVVCCILSIFPQMREAYRALYSSYFEVYVKTPLAAAKKRDTKGVYAHKKNVVGLDIPFPEPQNPDFIFDNSKEGADMAEAARDIVNRSLAQSYSYSRGDLIASPNTYFYCAYRGREFLSAWRAQRANLIRGIKTKAAPRASHARELEWKTQPVELRALLEAAWRFRDRQLVNRLVQKFEVEKRWHAAYGPRLKTLQVSITRYHSEQSSREGEDSKSGFAGLEGATLAPTKDDLADCRDYSLYIRAAELFERAYRETASLPYLNVLCKSLDTISSFFGELSAELKWRAARLIHREASHVYAMTGMHPIDPRFRGDDNDV